MNIDQTCDSNQNSFLIETCNNSNVNDSLRAEIDRRYRRSKVNGRFKFPRHKEKLRKVKSPTRENLSKLKKKVTSPAMRLQRATHSRLKMVVSTSPIARLRTSRISPRANTSPKPMLKSSNRRK